MGVRAIIKTEAKKSLKNNIVTAVLVILIAGVISMVASVVSSTLIEYLVFTRNGTTSTQVALDYLTGNITADEYYAYSAARAKLSWIDVISTAIGLLVGIFTLAKAGFFLKITDGENKKVTLKDFFKEGRFLESLGFYVIKYLKIFLWALLFVIPGIVKWFSYSMADYLKYKNPEKSSIDCLHESARLMNGYKGSLFVLILSFIGWFLLVALVTTLVGYIPGLTGTIISSLLNFVFMGALSAYVTASVTIFYRELTSPYLNEKYGEVIPGYGTSYNRPAENKNGTEGSASEKTEPFEETAPKEKTEDPFDCGEKVDPFKEFEQQTSGDDLGNTQSDNGSDPDGKQ